MTESIKYLSFLDAYYDESEDRLWVSNWAFNGLFTVDLKSYKVKYIGRFENEEIWKGNLHRRVIRYNNTLFFIPYNAKGINSYDLTTGKFGYIPVFSDNRTVRVADVVIKENQLLMFPGYNYQPLLILNMDTSEVISKPEWNKRAEECSCGPYGVMFDLAGICQAGNKIYMAPFSSNNIIEYDTDTDNIKSFSIDSKYHIRNITYTDNTFWITLTDSMDVLQWDNVRNSIEVYKNNDTYAKVLYPYTIAFSHKNDVFVLPSSSEYICKVDMITKTLRALKNYPNDFRRIRKDYLLLHGYLIKNDKIYLFPRAANQLLIMDLNTYELTGHELRIPESCSIFLNFENIADENNTIYENMEAMRTLDFYIDMISGNDYKEIIKKEADSGNKILNYILKTLS